MMNIPDGGRSRNKQEIQSVYRGRKGTGEDYSMHQKKVELKNYNSLIESKWKKWIAVLDFC